jgi:hypothetical protein
MDFALQNQYNDHPAWIKNEEFLKTFVKSEKTVVLSSYKVMFIIHYSRDLIDMVHIRAFLSSCLIFLFYIPLTHAVIIEISNLESFKNEIETLDSQALVIFDVDETLITPKEALFRAPKEQLPIDYQLLREYFDDLRTILEDEVLKSWKEIWISRILVHRQYQLMDEELPMLIRKLQNRGIVTIGLTLIKSGRFGVIPSIETWRSHQLKEFNIDFFNPVSPLYFPLTFHLEGRTPSFRQGILFTDKTFKGETLALWLEAVKWKPNLILFIDDSLPNLQSVESLALEMKIPFIGFHYIAKKFIPWELDEKLIAYQLFYLAEKGEWLKEEEAQILLNQEDKKSI